MNPTSATKPRPRAFRLDQAEAEEPSSGEMRAGGAMIVAAPDVFAAGADASPQEAAVEAAQTRGLLRRTALSWGGLFWSAATGLVSLAVGVWATNVIEGFFARSQTLGYIGLALVGAALVALAALAGREIFGLARQRRIAHLHIGLAHAHENDDRDSARKNLSQVMALYENRPAAARARVSVAGLMTEIVDGRDLIDIAERELMTPLDHRARQEIAAAAKRVSVITAIAPRAIIDVLFVAAQSLRLIRKISEIYGGRPGVLGFIKLSQSVGAHLAMTGALAVGDSLVQQILGHGIAARLSARLGEGVLNGMLTTRIGLSAMAVCRPMPFAALKAPKVADVAPFLFNGDQKPA